MKDRVSLYPGRIRLIPVEGQDNVYDLVRADEPIEEGTPLNKANILKDSTIQKYVNANINVPDDVFNYLGNYAEYWWKLTSLGTTKYRELKVPTTGSDKLKVYNQTYYDSISVNEDTGEITGDGEGIKITTQSDTQLASLLKGKYVVNAGSIYYIHTSMVRTAVGNTGTSDVYIKGTYYDRVLSESYLINAGIVSYVRSTNRNAYPDSGDYNGFSYEYAGIPFENMPNIPVKIETGSYVGTGTYGSSNPNSLTFSFVPKFLMIARNNDTNYGLLLNNNGFYIRTSATSLYRLYVTTSDNTIYWYSTEGTANQLNYSDTYYYVAIG